MLRVKLAVCGERVIRDAESNIMSIINIMDEIHTPVFPAAIPRFATLFVVNREQNDDAQQQALIRFLHNGTQIAEVPVNIDFQDKVENRVTLVLDGLVVTGPGVLQCVLIYNNAELGSWNIRIIQTGGAQPTVVQG